ncbi:hypothetical protein PV08_07417 [Exophiala spinifera]|uniref:Uncharacterized protein n=1 Tax=Exophiala spinifera TaxID=91928 RepID=A0A0D2B6V0_9EURO|nr:uncharacterized protein PV08_07417 [Exophiala spinifera]KIW14633.1 hypothetical protein PV08_07417 [Exophiala spinifera]
MEDAFYDTSWLVHSVRKLTPSFLALLAPTSTDSERSQQTDILSSHAEGFAESISRDRPRYESEEEKEKLGLLRQCKWTQLGQGTSAAAQTPTHYSAGRKRRRDDDTSSRIHGISISLIYEKSTYKFIIYTHTTSLAIASKRNRTAPLSAASVAVEDQTAVLLSKSSPAVLKALLSYLCDKFTPLPDIYSLHLPSRFIQGTLQTYLSAISSSLTTSSSSSSDLTQSQMQDLFIDVISSVKLTITFSAPVAPHLKSLDVAVAPFAVLKAIPEPGLPNNRDHFMGTIANFIWAHTGLKLPVDTEYTATGPATRVDEPEQAKPEPMKISRISTAAYAISCDHRVKFVARAVNAVDGPEQQPQDNCVRVANHELLVAVLDEARRRALLG